MAADAPMLRQLAAGFVATWRQLLGDSGVLLLLVAAPVLYAFFYPWPYADQAVTRVPVALVDLDGSSLSRQIARYAAASPRIELRRVTADEQSALVVYCKTSGRAALSACALQALGYQSVCSIAGGFDAWVQAELPVFMPKPVSFE